MHLTIDFETRSEIEIKKCGMYVYAKAESTEILCLAIKEDDKALVLWVPDKFKHLCNSIAIIPGHKVVQLIETADTIEAHNVGFDALIWEEILHKRYGFPNLPLIKLRCSSAKAAVFCIPQSLTGACQALGLSQQKDQTGYRIMMKMCKPRKLTKNNSAKWHENPEDFDRLCRYCMQDVDAEYELSQYLHDLSAKEQEVFYYDQIINRRGMYIDIPTVENLIEKVKTTENRLLLEIQKITGGRITSVRQIGATLEYLRNNGVNLANLQNQTVITALEKDMPSAPRRLLEIRQSLGKSSVSKLPAMKNRTNKDCRLRGAYIFNRASTGRWGAQGVQPHNFVRDSFLDSDIQLLRKCDVDLAYMLYDCPILAASKSLRGMICAAPGNKLFCSDFNSIEARVLAWLSGDEKILNAFKDGLDLYKVAATDIYNKKYEEITKEERQMGKLATLALGYGGAVGAFQAMADDFGVKVPEKTTEKIVLKWREAHPKVVKYWYGIEDTAKQVIRTGTPSSYGRIKFGIRGEFLHCRLPSGRLLAYYQPRIEKVMTKFGRIKNSIVFMGVDSKTNKWCKQQTYGGKLTENITSGVARDFEAEAIVRLEKKGYPVVLHTHDEIVAELPENTDKNLKSFEKEMAKNPEWALDCPIKAEGWEGKRYRK